MNLDSHAILNALPAAVLVRDGDGVVRFVNAAAERMLDVRAADLVGGRELPDVSAEQMNSGDARFEIYTFEVPLSIEILSVDGGGSLVVYRAGMQRQVEEYYTYISYDVKTLMPTVRGYIDLIRLGFAGEITPQQKEFLSIASLKGRVLSDAVETLHQTMLLDFNLPLRQKERFNINMMLVRLFTTIKNSYQTYGILIEEYVDLQENTDDMYADTYLLNIAFNRLLTHQLKQLSLGESIRFEIESKQQDQYTYLNVRIHSSERYYYTDYGEIKLARRIIELHGGTLTFNSPQDSASGFTIRLPVAAPA